jgi:hypothetical protein
MAAGDNSQNHTSMVVFWNTQHTKAYLKRKLEASDKRRRREDVTLFDEWLSVGSGAPLLLFTMRKPRGLIFAATALDRFPLCLPAATVRPPTFTDGNR